MRTHKEQLDERKQKILKAIVHEHIHTAEPVGSEVLVQNYGFDVRSATIRNEMAEMAELGYLRQPHTSAGRVPSDLGYRFYVDRLMPAPYLPKRQVLTAKEKLSTIATEIERIVSQTCRILTGLTCYTSVATQPISTENLISHIGLSKVGERKLLLVVVLSSGQVEHRIIDAGHHVLNVEVMRTSSVLAKQFIGKNVNDIRNSEHTSGSTDNLMQSELYQAASTAIDQVINELGTSEASVHIEGTNCILKQPEFKDLNKLETILAALEHRTKLYLMLSKAVLGPDVMVIIGSENPYHEMQDTSFVGARYRINDRTAGTIGVIGPTRMNYRHAVAAVEAMANNLSELLTALSLS
ncbi:MAG TPA: heat-inducible transcriptional repressor HrcA [Armatimonadota bacterium]|nr:heat-inducible transcriptional repressor HrcA [Armatimonadota bacterium]